MEENNKPRKNLISKDKLLETSIHYGHHTKRWNPAMKTFIHRAVKGVHIINLNKSLSSLELAYNAVNRIATKGGSFLFVGTSAHTAPTVRENAKRTGSYYVDHRWLGGALTNNRTMQNSIRRLRNLERLARTNFEGYTKKEGLEMQRELDKLEKNLGGIKFMRRLPSAVIVTSIMHEPIAIAEAKKLGIPVFGIADTNSDPRSVNYPIVGNDDSNKAVALIITLLADAIAQAKGEEMIAAYKESDDDVKVLGLVERPPRQPREMSKAGIRRKPRFEKSSRRPANPASDEPEPKVIRRAEVKPKEVKEALGDTATAKPATEITIEKPVIKEEVKEAPVVENTTTENEAKDYSKLTVVKLKELLKENNVEFKSTLKKADLVELATKNIK